MLAEIPVKTEKAVLSANAAKYATRAVRNEPEKTQACPRGRDRISQTIDRHATKPPL
jgi:hypothetical protein